MISVKSSNTNPSSIVAMGQRLVKAMRSTGQEYLMLNRGVNEVVSINLNPIIPLIDFNSPDIQVYPAGSGKKNLLNAINEEYFLGKAQMKNIIVTDGAISGLDITIQNLEVTEILLPKFFWGTYVQLMNLRVVNYSSYDSYEHLANRIDLDGKAVIICDPGNPLGEKYDDEKLLKLIEVLSYKGAVVLFDSPYRRLFYDNKDTFFQNLLAYENVIVIESFSKSLGLSGQRIGFLHCSNSAFIQEAAQRIQFATNGVNGFAQTLVEKLLSTEEGKQQVAIFKKQTVKHIKQNIDFLIENKLLATELYGDTKPVGIFAVVNKNVEELFQQRIGSVALSYFTLDKTGSSDNLSRILVSIPHEKFVSFFQPLKS